VEKCYNRPFGIIRKISKIEKKLPFGTIRNRNLYQAAIDKNGYCRGVIPIPSTPLRNGLWFPSSSDRIQC
jgi:hypothetical protein